MNSEQVKKMTDEELRIEVARLCGWTSQNVGISAGCIKPKMKKLWFGPKGEANREMPSDYCNDLNAMHEAEKLLAGLKASDYDSMLWIIIRSDWDSKQDNLATLASWFATARQRAEAFVLVMEVIQQ